MIKYVIIMIVFLLLLYYLSKYIVKQKGTVRGVDLVVGETVRLGPDSFVYVLSYKGTRYIVAQNKQSITLIDKIEVDDRVETQFCEVLEGALKSDSEGF